MSRRCHELSSTLRAGEGPFVQERSANGVSDFSVLQNDLRGKSNKLVLYAFDLLYLNGPIA